MLKSTIPTSMAGNPQRRTTYLISLTLVKVEALPEDEAGDQKESPQGWEGSPNKEEKKKKKKKKRKEEAEEVEEKKREEVVKETCDADEGSECKKEAATPNTSAKEEDEKSQVKVGSPVQSWQRPDRRDPLGQQRHKDAPSAISSTTSARQMVKVYGGATTEGTAVRREGPRSDAARPRTELYREPPSLYPKGDNGAEQNSRSRCSLPFSIPPQQVSGQRPDVVMRSHPVASAGGNPVSGWRELRGEPVANASQYHSAKTLDSRENREVPLGPYRASWADSDGRAALIRPMGVPMGAGGFSGVMTRDSPQGERMRMVSISYPGPPVSDAGRPQRKGVSRTLDNSDLLYATEDLRRTKDQSLGQDGTLQRAAPPPPPRDRKMLKFISGIFNKSTPAGPPPPPNMSPASFPSLERGSSEEEGEPISVSGHNPAENLFVCVLGH